MTDTTLEFIRELGNSYGFPHEVWIDNGLSFCGLLNQQLEEWGITHHTISPYVPASNKLAEWAVGQLKQNLTKIGKTTLPKMNYLLFRLNFTPVFNPGAESAFVRFFGREGKQTHLPSMGRSFTNVEVRKMKRAHEVAQDKSLGFIHA